MTGIIILDGPDACGKTTLQQELVLRHGAYPIHLTYPAPDGLTMWEYQTREMVHAISMSATRLVVVDRHWISERLYAKVFRGGSPWPHMGRMMHRVWMKHSAVYVLCLPASIELGVKRHNENLDEKHPYPDDKFEELLHAYLDFAATVAHNPFYQQYRIEIEGQHISSFMALVLDKMNRLQSIQYAPAHNPAEQNLLGHLATAKVLMVGEQSNPKEFHRRFECYYPFYEHGNSSLYLTEILDSLGMIEENVMWTNALQLGFITSPHVYPLYTKGVRRIITFGKKAEVIVDLMPGIQVKDVYHLPHPQYAKRFGVEDYDQLLKEALANVALPCD
jgi:thymidylate kinase